MWECDEKSKEQNGKRKNERGLSGFWKRYYRETMCIRFVAYGQNTAEKMEKLLKQI